MSYKIAMKTIKDLAMEGAKDRLRKGKPIDTQKVGELIDSVAMVASNMIEKFPKLDEAYKAEVLKSDELQGQVEMLADNLDKFEKDHDYPYTKGFEAGKKAALEEAMEEPEKPEPPVDIFKTPAEYMPEPEQIVVIILRSGQKREAVFAGGRMFITNPELGEGRIETDITEVIGWK